MYPGARISPVVKGITCSRQKKGSHKCLPCPNASNVYLAQMPLTLHPEYSNGEVSQQVTVMLILFCHGRGQRTTCIGQYTSGNG